MIFNMTGGSKKPENPLNVVVVSYSSESELIASTPEDTTVVTIGVVTTTPITGWCFSPLQPPSMATGEVWFGLGLTSDVEFNALKTNRILLAPTRAQQMVSGSLREVVAKSYLNGKWVDWISDLYLYDKGTLSDYAGSLEGKKVKYNGSAIEHNGILTIENSTVTISPVGGTAYLVYFTKKIDLSNYKNLYFNGSAVGTGTFGFGVWASLPTDAAKEASALKASNNSLADGTHALDISSCTGEYYVGIVAKGYGTASAPELKITMKQMYLT